MLRIIIQSEIIRVANPDTSYKAPRTFNLTAGGTLSLMYDLMAKSVFPDSITITEHRGRRPKVVSNVRQSSDAAFSRI